MLKISPVFKDYIWGGTKLKTLYDKKSDLDIVAESWELSTHKDGQCTIAQGPDAGKTLAEYIKEKGGNILGYHAEHSDELPILIKLIDARDNLSVQVHPDEEFAATYEGDHGKTEMWYILEAEEGAQLVYGFKKDMTREEFEERIQNNTLTESLNYVDVKKGDVFFIQPGTMHAIGKGILIEEVQQSSNVTYRVYDYGRKGADGKPRQLHIDKAVQVTNLEQACHAKSEYTLEQEDGYSRGVLAKCKYFIVERLDITKEIAMYCDENSFHSLLITEGNLKVYSDTETIEAKKGDSIFIPAASGNYKIQGKGQVILSTI